MCLTACWTVGKHVFGSCSWRVTTPMYCWVIPFICSTPTFFTESHMFTPVLYTLLHCTLGSLGNSGHHLQQISSENWDYLTSTKMPSVIFFPFGLITLCFGREFGYQLQRGAWLTRLLFSWRFCGEGARGEPVISLGVMNQRMIHSWALQDLLSGGPSLRLTTASCRCPIVH